MTKPWRTVSVLAAGLLALLMVLSAVAWSQWQGSSMSRASNYWNGRGYGSSRRYLGRARALCAEPEKGLNLAASASGITLRLPSFSPVAASFAANRPAELEIRSYPPAGDSEPPATDLEQYERWAAWLPQRLTIADLRISLPCAKDAATNGGAEVRAEGRIVAAAGRPPGPATQRAQAVADHRRAGFRARRKPRTGHAGYRRTTTTGNPPPAGSFRQDAALEWHAFHGQPAGSAWLLDWLGEWTATPTAALPDMPTDMRIGAGWALTLMQDDDGFYAWRATLPRFSTHIPAAWPVAGLGSCRATSTWPLEGRMDCGCPRAESKPTTASIVHPADGRAGLATPESAEYKRRAGSHQMTPGQLPVQLRVETQGGTPSSLQARMRLATPYALDIEQARLQTRSTRACSWTP